MLKGPCKNDEMKYVNKLMKNMWLNVWRDIGKEIKGWSSARAICQCASAMNSVTESRIRLSSAVELTASLNSVYCSLSVWKPDVPELHDQEHIIIANFKLIIQSNV